MKSNSRKKGLSKEAQLRLEWDERSDRQMSLIKHKLIKGIYDYYHHVYIQDVKYIDKLDILKRPSI